MKIIIPIITSIIAALLINYISDVLPLFRKFSYPYCNYCREKINWLDYIFLKKCNHCDHIPSSRRIIIFLITPILFVLVWLYPLLEINFFFEAIILTYFLVVFVIDLEHKLILNSTSIFGAVLTFFTGFCDSWHQINIDWRCEWIFDHVPPVFIWGSFHETAQQK